METQYGIHIVNLTYKAPSVNKAQIASIVYNVEPSDATQQAIYAQARDFMSLAEGSYEKFRQCRCAESSGAPSGNRVEHGA
ncbi:MAG: hypothetical protein L6V35_08110 [Alistipes putredinis]|nr:MAG: hypothetical protein L6V35_08110 [Alistipes putredinis]